MGKEIFNEALFSEEIPDYPANEPAPKTYEDADYALASGILSGNDKRYDED